MKSPNCLSEQDLTLYYYGELSTRSEQHLHIEECQTCAKRFAALSNDLDQLPNLEQKSDYADGTRMAARVVEQLNRRPRSWVPSLSAAVVTTLALVATIYTWTPQSKPVQTVQLTGPPISTMSLNEDMPDIDFLNDLDLLQELELLSQIEGV